MVKKIVCIFIVDGTLAARDFPTDMAAVSRMVETQSVIFKPSRSLKTGITLASLKKQMLEMDTSIGWENCTVRYWDEAYVSVTSDTGLDECFECFAEDEARRFFYVCEALSHQSAPSSSSQAQMTSPTAVLTMTTTAVAAAQSVNTHLQTVFDSGPAGRTPPTKQAQKRSSRATSVNPLLTNADNPFTMAANKKQKVIVPSEAQVALQSLIDETACECSSKCKCKPQVTDDLLERLVDMESSTPTMYASIASFRLRLCASSADVKEKIEKLRSASVPARRRTPGPGAGCARTDEISEVLRISSAGYQALRRTEMEHVASSTSQTASSSATPVSTLPADEAPRQVTGESSNGAGGDITEPAAPPPQAAPTTTPAALQTDASALPTMDSLRNADLGQLRVWAATLGIASSDMLEESQLQGALRNALVSKIVAEKDAAKRAEQLAGKDMRHKLKVNRQYHGLCEAVSPQLTRCHCTGCAAPNIKTGKWDIYNVNRHMVNRHTNVMLAAQRWFDDNEMSSDSNVALLASVLSDEYVRRQIDGVSPCTHWLPDHIGAIKTRHRDNLDNAQKLDAGTLDEHVEAVRKHIPDIAYALVSSTDSTHRRAVQLLVASAASTTVEVTCEVSDSDQARTYMLRRPTSTKSAVVDRARGSACST